MDTDLGNQHGSDLSAGQHVWQDVGRGNHAKGDLTCGQGRRCPCKHQKSCASLRRTCARLCHLTGGELEQIQFLLGRASVQTTERYLGSKQKLRQAVNDSLALEDA
jgi:hypothetical protein